MLVKVGVLVGVFVNFGVGVEVTVGVKIAVPEVAVAVTVGVSLAALVLVGVEVGRLPPDVLVLVSTGEAVPVCVGAGEPGGGVGIRLLRVEALDSLNP